MSQPIERAVSDSLEFTGRVEAVEAVDVRARVSGYITKVAFNAGARVKEGDLLFEIDPREYQAAVDSHAEGNQKLRANLARERRGDAHATPEVDRGGQRTRDGHRYRQQGRDGG